MRSRARRAFEWFREMVGVKGALRELPLHIALLPIESVYGITEFGD